MKKPSKSFLFGEGETALATAVAGNHLEIARLLVEAGSRLDAAVGHARSMPLSIAVNVPGDGVAMVKFLLEAGMIRKPPVVPI